VSSSRQPTLVCTAASMIILHEAQCQHASSSLSDTCEACMTTQQSKWERFICLASLMQRRSTPAAHWQRAWRSPSTCTLCSLLQDVYKLTEHWLWLCVVRTSAGTSNPPGSSPARAYMSGNVQQTCNDPRASTRKLTSVYLWVFHPLV